MSYPITKVSHSLCNPHGYWPQNGYFGRFKMCFYRILKMNNFPLQIFIDTDTAMMVQSFTDAGISIDFDRLLKLMAENSEAIEDFIQGIETGEPRFMFPVSDSSMKRLVIEETNRYSVSPEKYLKAAIVILYADNVLVTDSKVVH